MEANGQLTRVIRDSREHIITYPDNWHYKYYNKAMIKNRINYK
jgi:hypothetical protein